MCNKRLFFGSILGIGIVVVQLFACGFACAAVFTLEDLIAACKEMEHKINDITIEYEWEAANLLPEEEIRLGREVGLGKIITPATVKLIVGRSRKTVDVNDPDSLLFDLFLFETHETVMDGQHTWKTHRMQAWDGERGYDYGAVSGDRPRRPFPYGTISRVNSSYLFDLSIAPLGFTVFWGQLSGILENWPLSRALAVVAR
ncbi:MAG: hypothetical protein QHH07_05080 [Sedimentisphaerales bacterium]|jgi:hypothetical protein|nr:hypothetical protein [Sedimentisphaerales bacterium]